MSWPEVWKKCRKGKSVKRRISISIESMNNKDLKEVQKAKAAIRTLLDFASDMRETAATYKADRIEAIAPAEGEQKAATAFAYFYVDVDVDGLEEVLEKIRNSTDQLEAQLRELTGKIYMGLANGKPRE